jgi:hypothetical protein
VFEAGTEHWATPNTGATNESGFSGRGGGKVMILDGCSTCDIYVSLSIREFYWSSTEEESLFDFASGKFLEYNTTMFKGFGGLKDHGSYIRCLKD